MTDIIQELRGLIAGATPTLLGVNPAAMAKLLRAGAEQQKPRARDFDDINFDIDGTLISRAINHLPALLDRLEADEWKPIERKPEGPVNAVLWFPNMQFHDQHGDPFIFSGLRDVLERYYLAFWDGETWVEAGTGHDVFEDWKSPDDLPTHWRPLPDAPAIREVKP